MKKIILFIGMISLFVVFVACGKLYTVTFESNGGSDVAPITDVNSGSKISAPSAPTRPGYTFDGWHKDEALEEAFKFDTDTVTKDITLYAKWSKDTVKPILMGVSDVVLYLGSQEFENFDPLAGVSASDNLDGNITSKIVVTGDISDEPAIYTIKYSVSDAAGNKAEQDRKITVRNAKTSDFYIVNGSFSEPLNLEDDSDGWYNWSDQLNAAMGVAMVGNLVELDITARGTTWYANQFAQKNINMTQGDYYELTVKAKADADTTIKLRVEDLGANNKAYLSHDLTILESDTIEEYTVLYFVNQNSIVNGTGKFMIGAGLIEGGNNSLTKIYIESISVKEIEIPEDVTPPVIEGLTDLEVLVTEEFDPLVGVTVTDDWDFELTVNDIVVTPEIPKEDGKLVVGVYNLKYYVEDKSGNICELYRRVEVVTNLSTSDFVVPNRFFTEDQLVPANNGAGNSTATEWQWRGGGKLEGQIKDGIAKIKMASLPNNYYDGQFFVNVGLKVTEGRIYEITFKAKADIARPLMIAIEIGGNNRFAMFDLTTEWDTYTYYYTAPVTSSNPKFAFHLGTYNGVGGDLISYNAPYCVPTTFYFDDVLIDVVNENPITNEAKVVNIPDMIVLQNAAFDPLNGVTIHDNYSKAWVKEDITIVGTVNTAVLGTTTLVYKLDGKEFERNITVVAQEAMLANRLYLENQNLLAAQEEPVLESGETMGTGWVWKRHVNAPLADFDLTIAGNGKAVADIRNTGFNTTGNITYAHTIQLFQQLRVMETFGVYKISFKAHYETNAETPATVNSETLRPIRLSLEKGTTAIKQQDFNISQTSQTYEVLVPVTGHVGNQGKFGFFLGAFIEEGVETSFACKITLSDISIEFTGYIDDDSSPILSHLGNLDLEYAVSDTPVNIPDVYCYDISDGYIILSLTASVPERIVDGKLDISTAGTFTLTFRARDFNNNETTLVRTITVA